LHSRFINFSILIIWLLLHHSTFCIWFLCNAEWCALYTSHITQKAKKYHSGILRLASCGSYRMQVGLQALHYIWAFPWLFLGFIVLQFNIVPFGLLS
jgi:hypothetical protein